MRRILLAIMVFCFVQNALQCQWEIQHENSFMDIYNCSYKYIGDDYWLFAKIVDDSLLVFKTMNEGEAWNRSATYQIPSPENTWGRVDLINDSVGWATLTDGIYKMKKDGAGWELLLPADGRGLRQHKLHVLSENELYLIGPSEILKTSDGGLTWLDISPSYDSEYISACFINADTFIVAGNTVYQTFDGGKSWYEREMPGLIYIGNIEFISDTVCYFLARNSVGTNCIYKTSITFNDWSAITETNNYVVSFHFVNNEVALAQMQDSTGFHLMKSSDGGQNWKKTISGMLSPYSYHELVSESDNIIYLFSTDISAGQAPTPTVGPINRISTSIDQGSSWTNLYYSYPSFTDVFFTKPDKGIVLGSFPWGHIKSRGNAFLTADGGKTCEIVNNGIPTLCTFNSDTNGFIADNFGILYQSRDGGDSWFDNGWLTDSLGPGGIRDLVFVDGKTGYLLSKSNAIYRTMDNFNSWTKIWQCDTYETNSIFFEKDGTGYAVGDLGRIMKIEGSGTWRIIESNTTLPLRKVYFADNNTGWIYGGYEWNQVLLKTKDAGEIWFEIPGINFYINDFYFKDTLSGWAVGSDSNGMGIIKESKDGGLTWSVQIDSLSGALNALQFKDGVGWAVGGNGLILRMIDTTYITPVDTSDTSINNSLDIKPVKEKILNYPNPFSFETTISFELSRKTDIELSVYDLAGRKVCRLFNGFKEAGRHEYTWNAAGMKPGIYFCELKAGNRRQVQKMILLK